MQAVQPAAPTAPMHCAAGALPWAPAAASPAHLSVHAGALKVERVLAGGALEQRAAAVGVLAHRAEPGLHLR